VLAPIPRYVAKKCCNDPEHITNFDNPDFVTEMANELDEIDELLTGWALNITEKSGVFNIQCVADITDAPLSELTFQDAALWPANDPVHIIGPAYNAMARLISGQLHTDDNCSSENPPKRPRLASVVVQREEVAGSSQGRPAAAASWSTGMLPPARRGGQRGGYSENNSGFWRGREGMMRFGGRFGGYRGRRGQGGRGGRGRGNFN
jgi:hypothetical protein